MVTRQSEDYLAGFETTPADDCTPAATDQPVEGLVKKSAKAPEPPRSIAISGSVDCARDRRGADGPADLKAGLAGPEDRRPHARRPRRRRA